MDVPHSSSSKVVDTDLGFNGPDAFGPFDFVSSFSVIASCSMDGGLAYNGKIPWASSCSIDARFITTTTAYSPNPTLMNAVIMDRVMFTRLGKTPLKWRFNIVIDANYQGANASMPYRRLYNSYAPAPGGTGGSGGQGGATSPQDSQNPSLQDTMFVTSFEEALAAVAAKGNIYKAYVIGGQHLLSNAIMHPRCKQILLAVLDYNGITDEHIDMYKINALYAIDNKRIRKARDGQFTVQFWNYVRNAGMGLPGTEGF